MDFDLFIIYKKREPILVTGYKYATSLPAVKSQAEGKEWKGQSSICVFYCLYF
jgi:hypothetical protein